MIGKLRHIFYLRISYGVTCKFDISFSPSLITKRSPHIANKYIKPSLPIYSSLHQSEDGFTCEVGIVYVNGSTKGQYLDKGQIVKEGLG